MKINHFAIALAVVTMAAIAGGLAPAADVGALGLKVAPLEYKATLKENERKQGFIDVSNPSGQTVKVRTSVQGFKQIDDDGGLQFFASTELTNAIKPELIEFELGAREALRMSFTIEGNVLPAGDVYAAIFVTTEPLRAQNGVGQSVRVGTLFSLVNKAPSTRSAEITGLTVPLFQLGETATGSYRIKNTGSQETGFYPVVTIDASPSGYTKQKEGVLVFGGRERSNDISILPGYGVSYVEVAYGTSKKGQWVLLVAPWMIVAVLFIVLIIGAELLLLKNRRKLRHHSI